MSRTMILRCQDYCEHNYSPDPVGCNCTVMLNILPDDDEDHMFSEAINNRRCHLFKNEPMVQPPSISIMDDDDGPAGEPFRLPKEIIPKENCAECTVCPRRCTITFDEDYIPRILCPLIGVYMRESIVPIWGYSKEHPEE